MRHLTFGMACLVIFLAPLAAAEPAPSDSATTSGGTDAPATMNNEGPDPPGHGCRPACIANVS